MSVRIDGRREDQLRAVYFERNFTRYAEGSVLASFGETKVLCTATVEEKVPPFLRGSGRGWVTAEYAMLPRSTSVRVSRSTSRGGPDGRSTEIQRLVGRSLRACVDMQSLGERTIILDCDVLQADGGTRTAAVSGGFVALFDALRSLRGHGAFSELPLRFFLSAVSVGTVDGMPLLDLCYGEDSTADVDMNVVMNHRGEYVEIQGTGEGGVFTSGDLSSLLALAGKGTAKIIELQMEALEIAEGETAFS
jgi:ribonuclease PH